MPRISLEDEGGAFEVTRLDAAAPTGFFLGPVRWTACARRSWRGRGRTTSSRLPRRRLLKEALGARVPVELRVREGAGHFSFMHDPPPGTTEPLADRDAFLAEVTAAACRFVTR